MLFFLLFLLLLLLLPLSTPTQCPAGTTLSSKDYLYTYNWTPTSATSSLLDVLEHSEGTQYWFSNLESGNDMVIQQILSSGTNGWAKIFNAQIGAERVHVINNAGSFIYMIENNPSTQPIEITYVDTSDGVTNPFYIQSGFNFAGMNPSIFISSDDTTLYYSGRKLTPSVGILCSQTVTSTPVATCFDFGTTTVNVALMMSSTKFFVIGTDTGNKASMVMLDVTGPSADWGYLMDCPEAGACGVGLSAAVVSADSSKIFTMMPIGNTNTQLVFATLSATSGALVGNSLASSDTDCTAAYAMRLNGNKVYMLAQCSTFKLLIFDSSSNSFTNIYESSTSVYKNFIIDSSGSRLSLAGAKSGVASYYRVYESNLSLNGELSNSTTTFTSATSTHSYTSNTVVIGSNSSYSISYITDYPVSAVTQIQTLVWETNVYKPSEEIKIEVNFTDGFSHNISSPCSIDGTVSITYDFVALNSSATDSWVNFNTTTEVLSGTAPNVTSDTDYKFNYTSTWTTAPAGTVVQQITLTVKAPVPEQPEAKNAAAGAATAAAQAAVAAGGAIGATTSIMNGSPPISFWFIMNQLQMIILFLLIDDFTPSAINEYLGGLGFTMFNFNFIPIKELPLIDLPTQWIDFVQPSEKIETLGLESGSTFVNNVSLIFTLVFLMVVHLVLKCIPWCKNQNHPNFIARNIAVFRAKIIDVIFYVMYVRLLLEAHETMILSSSGEIKEHQASSASTTTSNLVSWAFFAICLIIPSVALYLFYSNRQRYDPDKKQFFMEYFAGLKNTKWARFYAPFILTRRTLFVCIVIFMIDWTDRIYVYFLIILVQVLYTAFLAVVRPYEGAMENIIDIVNESFLVVIVIYLLLMNNASKWTDSAITWFMNILTFSSLIIIVIMMSFMIADIIKKFKKPKKIEADTKTAETEQKVKIQPKSLKAHKQKDDSKEKTPSLYKNVNPYSNQTIDDDRTAMKSMESSRRMILPKLSQRHFPKVAPEPEKIL